MQFIVIGRDGTDEEALARRLAVREAHVANTSRYHATGNALFGTAILNENGDMCGSVMVMEFDSRQELDTWLANEPYVTGHVWHSIEIEEAKVAPTFLK